MTELQQLNKAVSLIEAMLDEHERIIEQMKNDPANHWKYCDKCRRPIIRALEVPLPINCIFCTK